MPRSRAGEAAAVRRMERAEGLRWAGVLEATYGPMRHYFYGLDVEVMAEIGKRLERRLYGDDAELDHADDAF
ncbi:hypothetical protein ACFL6C_01275 [Myxococcota bacterium]